MVECSKRLLALFGGHQVVKPPFWEPWFAMNNMLTERYSGDECAMADDLEMAALRLPGIDTNVDFRTSIQPIAHSGVWYGGGTLHSADQFADKLEPDWRSELDRLMPRRRAIARAERACWVVLPWCFHAVATSMGLESFALDCHDRPQFIDDAMNWVEARNRAAIERVVAVLRPDFVLYDGDCAYKTGTMIAPKMIRRFCVDPTRLNMQLLRDMDIPVVFHSDGKLDDVIPILLELGFSAVHGCEAQANDLGELVAQFGDRIVLCGNMDVLFLKQASLSQVRRKTFEMLTVGSCKSRYVAASNTSPLDYIPQENYVEMARAIAEFELKMPGQCGKDGGPIG